MVFQPATFQGLAKGIETLVGIIRPTLGPYPRLVAIETTSGPTKPPEILDSGGTIARRIIQIQGRDADVGAMFLRHTLWKLQEKVGDGTATAAVIFHTIFTLGMRYIVAGGNAMLLRTYLEEGLRIILQEIDRQTEPISGHKRLAGLVESICGDHDLSGYLGEIFDIIGAYGRLEVRTGYGNQFKREYVEGIYWEAGLHSRNLVDDIRSGLSILENGAVVISNLDLVEPIDMAHILEVGLETGSAGLLLVVNSVSERALSVILMKSNREKIKVLAVKTPGSGLTEQEQALADMAILTGGRALLKTTMDTFQQLKSGDLGRARRITVGMDFFNISGGKGEARRFREYVRNLQQTYHQISDEANRQTLRKRIGQMMGGSATLYTGGLTQTECETRKTRAERASIVVRNAILEGVVPGGGMAMLAIRPMLEKKRKQAKAEEERTAYSILLDAMEAPFRALLTNAGYDTGEVMARLSKTHSGFGIDLRTGKFTDMASVGIVDPAAVLKEAVHSAVSGAGLMLTTDIILHIKNPPMALET